MHTNTHSAGGSRHMRTNTHLVGDSSHVRTNTHPVGDSRSTHPSRGLDAVDNANQACSVMYLHGCGQYLALATQFSKPTFDPRSLNLPSIGALVGFYHACLGFPVKQRWLDAAKAGNCDSFDGLTYSSIARYCPDSDETILGYLAQQRQNTRAPTGLPSPVIEPATPVVPSNDLFLTVVLLSKLYTDDTGRFPVRARSGNQYVMIAYHVDGNLILQQPFKTKSDAHRLAAYNTIMTRLAAGCRWIYKLWTMKPVLPSSRPSHLCGGQSSN